MGSAIGALLEEEEISQCTHGEDVGSDDYRNKGIAAGGRNFLLGSHNDHIGGAFIGGFRSGSGRSRIVGGETGIGGINVGAGTIGFVVVEVGYTAGFSNTHRTAAGAGNVLIAGTIASSLTVWAGFMFTGFSITLGIAVVTEIETPFIMTPVTAMRAFFMVDTAIFKAAESAAGGTDIPHGSTAEKRGQGQQTDEDKQANGSSTFFHFDFSPF